MDNLRIATAQFENKSADKEYNLGVIDRLSKKAADEGADIIAFHECSITGYTFARNLSREQMINIAEIIPNGESTQKLIEIATRNKITILAGLFEKETNDDLYKAYICVDKDGIKAKYRKIHPFINRYLKPGNEYVVFDIKGWKCSILICYDNNIIENVRATTLLGAEVIFMPHVTMCTPSTRPGAGFVDKKLWENRVNDPTSLRIEFDGLKGRAWLMKWLPARAYDNGIYVVFSNPIGMDDDQLKNGCSMIIDPFGDILAECKNFDDEYVISTIIPSKIIDSGGNRYKQARKPELYKNILGMDHESIQNVVWMK
ncbi:MAG TPA: nitrilase family protein [bacterium]|nr:nitrilase family protein [bacterium]HPN42225.1 nitrilase family protein [bacterium]